MEQLYADIACTVYQLSTDRQQQQDKEHTRQHRKPRERGSREGEEGGQAGEVAAADHSPHSVPIQPIVSPRAGQGSGTDEAAEKAKRVRNLGKRLRQIEELKARVAAAGGSTAGLDAAQLEKLGQEAAVRAELGSL
ncbi:unnamed protein product [Closterium sp. Naga37s-1]|nr:unnamed protein product [Closterium sp. Naga37s-1]